MLILLPSPQFACRFVAAARGANSARVATARYASCIFSVVFLSELSGEALSFFLFCFGWLLRWIEADGKVEIHDPSREFNMGSFIPLFSDDPYYL